MPDAEYSADLTLLKTVAVEAGALAMSYFDKSVETWEKEPGHPVTEADIAVNDLLEQRLLEARPDYGWLSEESADTDDRLKKRRVFVVDPIDGTRAFMRGEPHFSIALAVLEDNHPVVAVIFAPAPNEMYTAIKGGGAWLNNAPIKIDDRSELEGARLIAEPKTLSHEAWFDPWPDVVLPEKKPNSTLYRMALVAAASWQGVFVMWPKWDWDVAAGALIIHEAGGIASTHTGAAFQFNRKNPVQQSLIAAGPMLHGLLVNKCARVRLPDPGES